jgi:signal peptidase I
MMEQEENIQEQDVIEDELLTPDEATIIDIDQEENFTQETTSERSSLLRRNLIAIIASVVFVVLSSFDHNIVFNPVVSPVFLGLGLMVFILAVGLFVYAFQLPPHRYPMKRTYLTIKAQNNVMEFLVVLPVLMVIFTIINAFFLSFSPISGTSMEPNFHDGEVVIFSHISKEYERFDVIIIYAETQEEPYLIKRVIGLPGEQVIIDNNEIYIDGVLIEQDFIDQDTVYTACVNSNNRDYCEFSVPLDSYFVLGDNRDGHGLEDQPSGYSIDSRTTSIGAIHRDDTFGKVVYSIANLPGMN